MQYAQLAYDTYMRTQGDVYIPWDELTSEQQACWEAVAEAVSAATREEGLPPGPQTQVY